MNEEILPTPSPIVLKEVVKPKRIRTKKSEKNYVSNADFTAAVSAWVKTNREMGAKQPLPEYVGECIFKMANNFAHRRNYSGYTYISDMISESLLTCVKYAHNFNPDKSDNAFAYFTEIINNSFKMFLNKEKVQHDIKFKMVSEDSSLSKYNYKTIDIDGEE